MTFWWGWEAADGGFFRGVSKAIELHGRLILPLMGLLCILLCVLLCIILFDVANRE